MRELNGGDGEGKRVRKALARRAPVPVKDLGNTGFRLLLIVSGEWDIRPP